MKKRTAWPQEQKDDMTEWHEKRMAELQYPPAIVEELRNARIRWLGSIPTEQVES